MNPAACLTEPKRRKVYRVAVAYATVAWLMIQAASILFPTFEARRPAFIDSGAAGTARSTSLPPSRDFGVASRQTYWRLQDWHQRLMLKAFMA